MRRRHEPPPPCPCGLTDEERAVIVAALRQHGSTCVGLGQQALDVFVSDDSARGLRDRGRLAHALATRLKGAP